MDKFKIIRTSREYLDSFRDCVDDIWPDLLQFLKVRKKVRKPGCLIDRKLDRNPFYCREDNTIYLQPFTRSTIRECLLFNDEDISEIGGRSQKFLKNAGGIEEITEKEAPVVLGQSLERLFITVEEATHAVHAQICKLKIYNIPPIQIYEQGLWYDFALAKLWVEGLSAAAVYSFPYKFPINKGEIHTYLRAFNRYNELYYIVIPYFTRNADKLQEWIHLKEPIIENQNIQRFARRYAREMKREV